MRYIDTSDLTIPPSWRRRAKRAIARIEQLGLDRRRSSAAWTTCAVLWRELVPSLEKLSFGKCWYCETYQERSDMPVDHFRPKGEVEECPDHGGYWWLALDPTNFRLSCTFCNSRRASTIKGSRTGKQASFPLLHEELRAKFPPEDHLKEEPCLLDPTNPNDPELLWFQDDGSVVPRIVVNETQNMRAVVSIERYHFNHFKIKGIRKILHVRTRTLVADGKRHYLRLGTQDQTAADAFETALRELRLIIAPWAPYSAAARAFLQGLNDDDEQPWISDLLAMMFDPLDAPAFGVDVAESQP